MGMSDDNIYVRPKRTLADTESMNWPSGFKESLAWQKVPIPIHQITFKQLSLQTQNPENWFCTDLTCTVS